MNFLFPKSEAKIGLSSRFCSHWSAKKFSKLIFSSMTGSCILLLSIWEVWQDTTSVNEAIDRYILLDSHSDST